MLQVECLRVLEIVAVLSQQRRRDLNWRLSRWLAAFVLPDPAELAIVSVLAAVFPVSQLQTSTGERACHDANVNRSILQFDATMTLGNVPSEKIRKEHAVLINERHAVRASRRALRRSAGWSGNSPLCIPSNCVSSLRASLCECLCECDDSSPRDCSQPSHIATLSGVRTRATAPKTRYCCLYRFDCLRRCLLVERGRNVIAGTVDNVDIVDRRWAHHSRSSSACTPRAAEGSLSSTLHALLFFSRRLTIRPLSGAMHAVVHISTRCDRRHPFVTPWKRLRLFSSLGDRFTDFPLFLWSVSGICCPLLWYSLYSETWDARSNRALSTTVIRARILPRARNASSRRRYCGRTRWTWVTAPLRTLPCQSA